jgi:hypothetical protein
MGQENCYRLKICRSFRELLPGFDLLLFKLLINFNADSGNKKAGAYSSPTHRQASFRPGLKNPLF